MPFFPRGVRKFHQSVSVAFNMVGFRRLALAMATNFRSERSNPRNSGSSGNSSKPSCSPDFGVSATRSQCFVYACRSHSHLANSSPAPGCPDQLAWRKYSLKQSSLESMTTVFLRAASKASRHAITHAGLACSASPLATAITLVSTITDFTRPAHVSTSAS